MSTLLLAILLLAGEQPASRSGAPAAPLRLYAPQTSTLTYPGATAVFSLHPEIAGASLSADGSVLISARAAGFTHVVLVSPGRTESVAVTVEDPPLSSRERERIRAAAGDWQVGTYDVRYASDPQMVQTTLRTARQLGSARTELVVGSAWRLDGAEGRAFTLPTTSYTRATLTSELTLFDRVVETSPLTVTRSTIRGVHARRKRLTAHAGYSFFGNFEGLLLPTVKEAVSGGRYDIPLDGQSTVTPQLYYFHSAALSGHGGVMGSLVYRMKREGVRLLAEAGASPSPAFAAELDAQRSGEAVWARVRITPEKMPTLSTGGGTGRTLDASWTKAVDRLTLAANGSAHTSFAGTRQTTTVAGARAELQLTSRLTTHAGAGLSRFASAREAAIRRISIPTGLQFKLGRLETAADYEFSMTGSDLFGHSVRGSATTTWSRVRLSGFAERQQHAPTVRQILGAAPWVAQRLEALAINATTTRQLADLLRTSSTLNRLGYAGELGINVAPLVNRVGGSVDLALFGDRSKLTLTTMRVREELIVGASGAATHSIGYSQGLGGSSELFVNYAVVCSDKRGGIDACRPLVAASLRQGLSRVPLGVLGQRSGGDIAGVVFRDDAGQGTYAPGLPVLAGVVVILDAQQRTTTDRKGRFRFRRVAGGRHLVEIRFTHEAPFFFTTPSHVEARPDANLSFGIGFSLGRLFVTVKNDAGAPLNDLLVRISTPGRDWTARTAGEGQFSLEGLPAGVYDVRIDPASVPPGYPLDQLGSVSVRVEPAAPARILLTMGARRAISGAVRVYVACAGTYARVAGATVKSHNGDAHTTDQEGRFVFRDMPAGVHTLVAEHDGRLGTANVTLADGPATLKDIIISLREGSSSGSGQCAATK